MAVLCHIVTLKIVPINAAGQVKLKDSPNTTMSDMLTASGEIRVVPNDDVPNSAGYPTIEDYILAEAANDFVLGHINQTHIITYDAGGLNSAS